LTQNESTIYGLRAILEAIEADTPIHKVYLQRGLKGALFQALETAIRKKGIGFSYVPAEKLQKMAPQNHQGAVAKISPVGYRDFAALAEEILQGVEKPLFLLLDHITDVRNFGAILRTAECCGVHAVLVPKKGAAPLSDDAVKTSAGAAFRVPIAQVDHILDALYYLQTAGVQTVAATEKTDQSVYEIDFRLPTAIVMGAEDRGISPAVLKAVEHKAKLPLMGSIGSLNVSVACGVFLYEAVRQRIA
jgi:23S rRNA (guanosine2251-2'-O)-methyltransferase